tara:strand:+ start:371 stop:961 length:591 start_codon:yes stop_codon:yes gene_type:complete
MLAHPILQRLTSLGFAVFDNGDYDLNIVGIRKANGTPNTFDDVLHVIYKVNGQWVDRYWPVTTDPGTYWLEHPTNPAGTAAVVADRQYRGVWQIGKHKGKYTALVQTGGEIAVHRDDNHDAKVDYRDDNIVSGYYGINCHRATTRAGGSVSVDKWSAGCQVFAVPSHFDAFMSICKKQRDLRGWSNFSYVLLNDWE